MLAHSGRAQKIVAEWIRTSPVLCTQLVAEGASEAQCRRPMRQECGTRKAGRQASKQAGWKAAGEC